MKIIGKKLKMTQTYVGDAAVAVTPIRLQAEDLDRFSIGDRVHAQGTTKGHGFAGVVKRHGFSGGPKTHGQKNRHRAPGSIGNTSPQRVIPGRRMAGHMGVVHRTVKNLTVVGIDRGAKAVLVKGAVPGPVRGTVALIT